MSIHNVTPTMFDHRCSWPGCAHERQGLPHSEAKIVEFAFFDHIERQVQITCPACGSIECFKPDHPAAEETSPTRDEASREQIRNNRLLHKHLGLPVR